MENTIELSEPIECIDEKYEGLSGLTALNAKMNSEQWSVLPDSEIYPIQKENSKKDNIYKDIEYTGNKWMEMACLAALDSVKANGGPFAAVVVQIDDSTNKVLRYWKSSNQVTKANDPTAHAEVMAVRSACASLGVFNLGEISKAESSLAQAGEYSHCEIYSSCEPCPMCYSAVFWARIPTLYFGATRFDAEAQGVGFSDAEIYSELKKPYTNRKTRVCQCSVPNSLDAFNVWKNSDKIDY